ncbi:MAG: isopentenyl-diphosphate Delta-isomerase [Cyclobacteriaceae bacterium]|nr:isopentenyl-diphosphate Delta-isomerase [Cyclobacteriaceae bacterium]
MEKVILVNDDDREIGTMEKLEAHSKGLLHRAFSILIFNSKGEILMQKRASSKYHSGGLWTNACCSHPLPKESMTDATARKLKQEMGIELFPEFAFKFIYKAELENNLTEHELDYVFIGRYDGKPEINLKEVEDWRYMPMEDLYKDLELNPQNYTVWFKIILHHPEFELVSPD